jgi:hypothetical protein
MNWSKPVSARPGFARADFARAFLRLHRLHARERKTCRHFFAPRRGWPGAEPVAVHRAFAANFPRASKLKNFKTKSNWPKPNMRTKSCRCFLKSAQSKIYWSEPKSRRLERTCKLLRAAGDLKKLSESLHALREPDPAENLVARARGKTLSARHCKRPSAGWKNLRSVRSSFSSAPACAPTSGKFLNWTRANAAVSSTTS